MYKKKLKKSIRIAESLGLKNVGAKEINEIYKIE